MVSSKKEQELKSHGSPDDSRVDLGKAVAGALGRDGQPGNIAHASRRRGVHQP